MAKKTDNVVEKIQEIAKDIYNKIKLIKQPELVMPIRALSNVEYNEKEGYFKIMDKIKSRTLTASTIKTFAQTLRMMGLSKELIEKNDIATKREAYYVSKNWGDARFKEQPESDTVMDDIEAMMRVNREQIGFIPGEKGGAVAGKLTVIDVDQDTKKELKIDCTKFGSGAYAIPSSVEHLKFETNAKFVLAIETAGMFERLNKHKYWKKTNCIIIAMSGVPTRATRRFMRKLADENKLPVYVFTDGDPYGYFSIYRTLKVGSGNAAHINKFFCVPNARFIGVTPQDIEDYKLPTHPLKEVDFKKIKDVIKNDPFCKHHKEWQKALQKMAKMKVRVEQQAFSAHSLNFVMETYLPKKLKDQKTWLP
ncbi:DNA topoisomerase IV subunit A [Candidatus Woesearchaeota archaeon]|jgi:DNA topoisomerase VI subunit A|nr:DNA topoisomerase IV subunit A [Candidatus Woesearchaeota archaeon]MBT4110519.1 DNA topoisomerase IV subunit A [Candidatus Woesearchaeota archaeon]MBT4335957.1 DNA topoisomerase IV subunit A [Candidatus Woesearchaeota archaeon]MBT4469064.1 DNA topoisomerase IV subunit A [Candidatus Woesearchaeota archaeon]MBT6744617.1 DNA topoisomerase IV subunit A [Candidatus Woesearchaeota archaeon]